MRLADPWFEAEFYGDATATGHRRRPSIDGAQGLFLWCPCGLAGKPVHGLLVPFANPRNAPPAPPDHGPVSRDGKRNPRWTMSGTGLDDLSLTPSIDVGDDHCWHGFITNGEVT